jgi:hypothetical protein
MLVRLTGNKLNPTGYWSEPIPQSYKPKASDLDLFDQNGYDLTKLEQQYATYNGAMPLKHRSHRTALKTNWFIQDNTITGPVLNHSLLFERKAYSGLALDQLIAWAKELPLLYKIIAMRPKWGLDFSMDYVDDQGNAFELLHWEYDGFSHAEIQNVKQTIEPIIQNIDWARAAADMIKRKAEWHHLDFFEQSDWKCNYFGIPKEKFKMVIWS